VIDRILSFLLFVIFHIILIIKEMSGISLNSFVHIYFKNLSTIRVKYLSFEPIGPMMSTHDSSNEYRGYLKVMHGILLFSNGFLR
jgi:hypothetical protein